MTEMQRQEIIAKNLEIAKKLKKRFWFYFAEICNIPHGSGNEAGIRNYILNFAKENGLNAVTDETGNVLITKQASPGMEKKPWTCLQSHLDMVCKKFDEIAHDFTTDPIAIIHVDGVNSLCAGGTTLGADNGIGVAYMLAIAEDRNLIHGTLELLFTIDEERGLTGAKGIKPDFIKSKTLINLDSEKWGWIFMSCAGGIRTEAYYKFKRDKKNAKDVIKVSLMGFKGGHSGDDIDKIHENPIKTMGRVIDLLTKDNLTYLVSIDGENPFNAIPTSVSATFKVRYGRGITTVKQRISIFKKILKNELSSSEPNFDIQIEKMKDVKNWCIEIYDCKIICNIIRALPHGILRMSPNVTGLVQTSTNIGSITTKGNRIVFQFLSRSSIDSEISVPTKMIESVFDLATSSHVKHFGQYPGWKPNTDSKILRLADKVFTERNNGTKPEIKFIHAGLETGLIGKKFLGIDMISYGPTLRKVHSPDENLEIDTANDCYDYTVALLKAKCEEE